MFYDNYKANNRVVRIRKNNLASESQNSMLEKKRYSEWEYDEIDEGGDDQGGDNHQSDDTKDNPDGGGDDTKKNVPEVKDDDVIFELPDGTKVTRKEARDGYMRHQDYTRKTQELSQKEKEQMTKSQKIVENPEDYPAEDVKTAEYFLKILKSKYGIITKEEFDAEIEKRDMHDKISKQFDSVDKYAEELGIKKPERLKLIDHMKENQIHSPLAAFKDLYEDDIFQAKLKKANAGNKKYDTERKGEKPPVKGKDDTRKTMSEFLDDELEKIDTVEQK